LDESVGVRVGAARAVEEVAATGILAVEAGSRAAEVAHPGEDGGAATACAVAHGPASRGSLAFPA